MMSVFKEVIVALVIMKILAMGLAKIEGHNQEYYICPPYCGVDHTHKEEDEED